MRLPMLAMASLKVRQRDDGAPGADLPYCDQSWF